LAHYYLKTGNSVRYVGIVSGYGDASYIWLYSGTPDILDIDIFFLFGILVK
jgi:hypothetical protein